MHHLTNNTLAITIDAKGAELKTIKHLQHNLDYMWSGDGAYWAKTSPVLFPIVGALKDDRYTYRDKAFGLSRHGFAREAQFVLTHETANSLRFTLESNEETKERYPFDFRFSITYTLEADTLVVTYTVENKGDEMMLFSVGGHPAFRLPLAEGTAYNDYRLRFAQKETAGRWPIAGGGLIEETPLPLLADTDTLPLTKELFAKDAIVLKHLQSKSVRLESDRTPHGLQFHFEGFPFLGLWAAPGADFVCIEPWCGIADGVNSSGKLEEKEGIMQLPAGNVFEVAWRVRFY